MTTVHSQNGWIAYPDTSHFVRKTVAEFAFWAANADVAVVLGEFVRRFAKEVEPLKLHPMTCWSYANRLVRGSTSVVSNHGSATAIDLNAPDHPRGVRNTFSPNDRDTMHHIKNSIMDNEGRPVLRLGMDYENTPDDMHIEINANAARVKQAADKIRKRDMELTKANLADIGEAVAAHKIPNKSPGAVDGVTTLAGSMVDIERTQDNHTSRLAAIERTQTDILLQLNAIQALVTPKATK